ncbi:hypothetical protein BU26DRAFT_308001 [Trematosphaeria pertusa]|uniref:Uncharacterized protein n=1 Tax=Trematosphaeria pertusa TaxID=390896 RepID=A0A6A6IEN7_9PLEO|nr:uncharacterized protein BU26DRAFT_308001 [Trematosphaeria pertusa]KAF2248866.1 hypothetical protein BU26DRAFT_308001 [Trematosphaeria pertusa]
MCLYYRKLHTCGCISKPLLSMCRTGVLSNTLCTPLAPPPADDDAASARKSHFQCYDCLRLEAFAEHRAKLQAAHDQQKGAEMAAKAEKFARREREQRVRREAAERAQLERERERARKEEEARMKEQERREGGLWIDAAAAGRKKGRKAGGGPLSAPLPRGKKMGEMKIVQMEGPRSAAGLGAPPPSAPLMGAKKPGEVKIGEREPEPKSSASSLDPGGRAGVWGPKKGPTNGGRKN